MYTVTSDKHPKQHADLIPMREGQHHWVELYYGHPNGARRQTRREYVELNKKDVTEMVLRWMEGEE